MFRKLISNLPFSPSLVNQLSFYSRRLKKEQATRKIGLVFTALAVALQSLTFVAPAQASVQASLNDIIYGGGTHSGIVNTYQRGCDAKGRCDIRAIFNAFGINATNLKSAKYTKIYSSVSNGYYSTGRNPRDGNDRALKVANGPTIYSRTLSGWSRNVYWPALEVINTSGQKVWILLDCGNIVTQVTAKPKNPDMKITKTANKTKIKKGEKVTFTIKATNIGNATAKNVLIYDDAPVGLDLLNEGLATDPIKSTRRWQTKKRFDIAAGQTYTYKINAVATKWGPVTLTNKACVDFFDVNIWNNCDDATVTVPQGCPFPGKENISRDDPNCKTNPGLTIEKVASQKELKVGDIFDYVIKATNKGDTSLPNVVITDKAPTEVEFLEVKEPRATNFRTISNPKEYTSGRFALSKGASVTVTIRAKIVAQSTASVRNTACVTSTGTNTNANACDDDIVKVIETCPTNPSIAKDSKECQPPCPIEGKENLPQNSPECRPCDEVKTDQDNKDISCLELHKKARNITQQITNANGTQAKASDSIEYTLSVTNKSKETRKGFVIEENIDDVLEYADIIDASGATYTDKPTRMLTWSPVDIKPNETVTRTILVKIKSTIPATPASTSDPSSYDMKLFNVYGDQVMIELPPHPIKTVEQTVSRIPSTGLGTNVIISTIVVMLATYFYFRSRTMVKEVGLVRQQFNYAAGA